MTSQAPTPNRMGWVALVAGGLFIALAIYSLISVEKLGVWAYGYSAVLVGFGIYAFSCFGDFSRLKALFPKLLQNPGSIAVILFIAFFAGIIATSVLLEYQDAGWEEVLAAILLGIAGWIFWGTLLVGLIVVPIWGLYKLAAKKGADKEESWK